MGVFREEPARTDGIAAHLTQLADGVGKLMVQHLQLARLEVVDDVRSFATPLSRLLVSVPFVLVGYALLCGGLAVFLARTLPLDLALALVGGGSLLIGAIGVATGLHALKRPHALKDSLIELKSSAAALSQAERPPHSTEKIDDR